MKRQGLNKILATVFGLGYFPVGPGTAGSLGGLVLCISLHENAALYLLAFIIFFSVGVVSSARAEELFGDKDPSMVVIDEFACIFVVYMLVPLKVSTVVIGFIAYRVIDIMKPPPIKAIEKFRGGWGIMLDDLMAGIYSNLILQILISVNVL
jgi:phosphatidylglycerophosphatase A